MAQRPKRDLPKKLTRANASSKARPKRIKPPAARSAEQARGAGKQAVERPARAVQESEPSTRGKHAIGRKARGDDAAQRPARGKTLERPARGKTLERPARGKTLERPARGKVPAGQGKGVSRGRVVGERSARPAGGSEHGARESRQARTVRGRKVLAQARHDGEGPARFAATRPARPKPTAPRFGSSDSRPARDSERPTCFGTRASSSDSERPTRFGTQARPAERAERPARFGAAQARVKPAESALPPARTIPKPQEPGTKVVPHINDWLFTTREGSEQDLVDELALLGVQEPSARILAPSLVLSHKWPKREHRGIELAFARQALPVQTIAHTHDLHGIVDKVAQVLVNKLGRATSYALHVWVPDSTEANTLAALADDLDTRIAARLETAMPAAKRIEDGSLRRMGSVPFAQVCVVDTERAIAGVMYSNQALALAKGGRTRVRVTGDFPSRAARKLEEALAWIGIEPGPGEVCVDLGAAPGGWTYVLSERKARVIAVDPAKLKPEIAAKKNVQHVQRNAFTFTPDGQVDWLFCDMAYRPLEVAAMLARWGRKRMARMLVANIKLPMTRKAELVQRVRDILEREGEWNHVRVKQLYHDRDEITLSAHRA